MTLHYEDAGLRLWHGSNLDLLPTFEDASFDSIVTDPPYELGFMGKGWDSSGIAYNVDVWRECLRVLKPGGHLLAFGGSRTWHRIAVAIEDAGFEVRDSIAWLYGSGFPKSMNVAKAIDKIRDDVEDVRAVCRWLRARIEEHPTWTVRTLAESFGFHPRMVEHWAARDTDSQPSLPTLSQWDALREAVGFDAEMDDEVARLNMRKGEFGEEWASRDVVGVVEEWKDRTNYALTSRDGLKRGSTKNPLAEPWEGWGTALKPAFEPIVVARKPFRGTVAANVLAHATGAINIEATRTPMSQPDRDAARVPMRGASPAKITTPAERGAEHFEPATAGRWPTNVLLERSQAEALDAQTGVLTSGKLAAHHSRAPKESGILGAFGSVEGERGYGDSGGASRYFPTFRYEAKAPASERPNVEGTVHATVKPLELMRWLVRLVTRPGGRVLDPFAGSGTTGEAALLEGMECDLIELEADHLPLILARVRKPLHPAMFGDWEDAS